MHDKVGDIFFRFGREAREFSRAEFTLRDVFRLSPIDPLLDVERQVFISPSHITNCVSSPVSTIASPKETSPSVV